LTMLLPGLRLEARRDAACYVLDKVYSLDHQHGAGRLADLVQLTPEAAAVFCQDERLGELQFGDFLFLDTETTGLAGAGTLAFMVGAAFFERGPEGEAFVVRQYFLRDHGDEPAMLEMLAELVEKKAGLITFNGRSFDLPLLDNRYLMNRMGGSLQDLPHIDLLHPARRLWRRRLESCSLSSLEQNLLRVQRSHEDVPGWLIPGLYHDYVRSGDGRLMQRVFYHNELDMLSMVTLAARITRQFAAATEQDDPVDLYSLGRWQADLGLAEDSEHSLRLATAGDLPLELYHQALHKLGWLLKRTERRDEAVLVWQQIAATSFDDVGAHVELAKHFEWHDKKLAPAISWTLQALALVDGWRSPGRAALVREELSHRLKRLQRKHGQVRSINSPERQ
jgi:uncharacterized protein YprB with RNaseH-like and TPR domain